MNIDQDFFGIKPKPEPLPADEPPDSGPEVQDEADEIVSELVNELKTDEGSETVGKNAPVVEEDGDEVSAPVFNVSITGRLLLYGTDLIVPRVMIYGAKTLGYKTDRKPADMVLTDKEIDMLEPFADNVTRELFEKLTPMQQFVTALMVVYGSKL